jgi:hypothetical protein
MPITSELLELASQILEFLVVLDAGKNHLVPGTLARGSLIYSSSFLVPSDAGVLVCIAVIVTFNRAGLATIKPVEERANLVGSIFADAVAWSTFLNEVSPAERSCARAAPADAAIERTATKKRLMDSSPAF